jgi:hypothetical protein
VKPRLSVDPATTLPSEHRDSFMALQVLPECHPVVTAPKPLGLHMADTCHRRQVAGAEFKPRFSRQAPACPARGQTAEANSARRKRREVADAALYIALCQQAVALAEAFRSRPIAPCHFMALQWPARIISRAGLPTTCLDR